MSGHLQLYDAHGRTILLGRQLGAGGEGVVFDVQGAPQMAAKWYKHLPTPRKADKLTAMAHGSDPALSSIAAWPAATLHKSRSGPLVGFLMPKVVGYQPIHTLYSPANRKFSFPKADWAFLVYTARNVASAVAAIHDHGHVVGDINQGNVLVGQNATIKLIDCDSFQIRVNGRNFPCEVGVPEFTPPELHGQKTFADVTRIPNHDAFGLAVLIFHLIFMGRHPFAGRFLGKGDKPIDDAIKEFRFAFGQAAGSKQMAPPPHSLSLLQTSVELASLFERAFSESGARGCGRPTALEWLTALDRFRGELTACAIAPAHKFHRSLGNCPWCNIQRNAGPDFFISVTIEKAGSIRTTFDLTKAWSAIRGVPQPDTSSLVIPRVAVSITPTPLPSYLGFTRNQAFCLRAGALATAAATVAGLPIILSLALSLILLAFHCYTPNRRERRKRVAQVSALEQSLRSKQEAWAELGKKFHLQFVNKTKALEDLKNRYESLSTSMAREKERLEQAREAEQRKNFLERHFIKDYKIDGIGRDRRATLLSYGIETLYDITPRGVDQVPGFGPALTSALVTLRRRVEAQFRFDPQKGVDPAAVSAINQKYALQLVPLEKHLLSGPRELISINSAAKQQRAGSAEGVSELARALAQAKANAVVTESDGWLAIVLVVLMFGFGFRFAVGNMLDSRSSQTIEKVVEGPHESLPMQDEPPVLMSHEPAELADRKSLSSEAKERLRSRYIQKNMESRAEIEKIEKNVVQEYEAQGTVSQETGSAGTD